MSKHKILLRFQIQTFKIPELKRELKLRGLAVSGKKEELVERLQVKIKSRSYLVLLVLFWLFPDANKVPPILISAGRYERWIWL